MWITVANKSTRRNILQQNFNTKLIMSIRFRKLVAAFTGPKLEDISIDIELNQILVRHQQETAVLENNHLRHMKNLTAEQRRQVEESYNFKKEELRLRQLKELGLSLLCDTNL